MVALPPRFRRITFRGQGPVPWGRVAFASAAIAGGYIGRWLVASVDAKTLSGGAGWRVVVRLSRFVCPCEVCRLGRKSVSLRGFLGLLPYTDLSFEDEE